MNREEMIIQAIEIIRESMEYNGIPDDIIRSEAEQLSNVELQAFLMEELEEEGNTIMGTCDTPCTITCKEDIDQMIED